MKNRYYFGVLAYLVVFSCELEAARFKFEPLLKNQTLLRTYRVATRLVRDQDISGDQGFVAGYSFERKMDETDAAAIRELQSAKGNLSADESKAVSKQNLSAKELLDFIISPMTSVSSEGVDKAKQDLIDALLEVKADKSLRIYGAVHADVDGTWHIISVLDTRRNEALLLKIGYRDL